MDFTEKNPKYFYSLNEYKELKVLEDYFQTILDELIALRESSENGYWRNTFPHYLYPGSVNQWQVFTFRFFGIKHPVNCSLCPKTTAILNKLPGLVTAEFSYLPANTKIKPHKGFTKMVTRVHLGLIIPKDCGIRVGSETHTWQPGKLLIFDDSFEHEAWNNSNEDRFVLMLDVANPLWGYSAEEICKYKIENMNDEFMLTIFTKEQWAEFYKKGEFSGLDKN
ncbi:MAG: aspartyl/asparaginyl beta-hydroxylase domain-containing protein [Bacteroidia bacterium]